MTLRVVGMITLVLLIGSYSIDKIQDIIYRYKGKRITSYRKYVPKKLMWLENFAVRLGILFTLWLIISWVNVNMHNLEEGYVYPTWNFFRIFLRN